jgi:hypothetical protein
MVMKPDGTWRPCDDYHQLNLATTLNSYPLPNIQDLSSRLQHLQQARSKVGLQYYQIPVQEGDIHKTAVITPFGLWEFLMMPFGLGNNSQSFQHFMDEVLSGLDFTFCYLDDIPIGSSNAKEHLHHLHLVLHATSGVWPRPQHTLRNVSWLARRLIFWATTSPLKGCQRSSSTCRQYRTSQPPRIRSSFRPWGW